MMKFERLGNIVVIEKGKKHNLETISYKNSLRVLQIDDLRNDTNLKYTNDKTGVLANNDDILIAWDGANAGTIGYGKSGYIGSTIALLRIKIPDQFSTSFVGRFLQTQYDFLRSKSTGATIPHINRKALENLKIPVIDKREQTYIAKILSKAEKLIEQRKQSISLLDEFLKSTILEMFGDPMKNEKGWKKVKLLDICNKIGSGATPRGGKENYHNEGISLIRSMNVHNDNFICDDLAFINESQADELKNVVVKKNDVLLNITGASVARCCLVLESILPARVNQHVCIIRPDIKILDPIFLSRVFTGKNYQLHLIKNAKSKGATRQAITKKEIEEIRVIAPPIELQNQFAQVVGKTEAIKAQYKSSLQELENLYGSLSQKAFKGELKFEVHDKTVLAIPESKKGFAKQVLGGKIVSLFKDDKNFTRIKFQKLQYLAEHIAEEDLQWNYYRLVAGPYDNKFMHNVANKLKQNKWFEERDYKFYPLEKINDIEKFYQNYFGSKQEKLDKLFKLLKNASEKFCEAISTIYAVWNNHIILKQPYNKEKIKSDFFDWSRRKETHFTEDEFEKAIAWMQKHNIVPTGFGYVIKEKIKRK